MPNYPAEWRRALELLAGSPEGCTEALLAAHGFAAATVAGLVTSGLATSTTQLVLAGVVMRLRITDGGHVALEKTKGG